MAASCNLGTLCQRNCLLPVFCVCVGMYACTCFTVSHLKNLQGFLNLIYTVGSSSTGKIVSVNKTDNVVICFPFS